MYKGYSDNFGVILFFMNKYRDEQYIKEHNVDFTVPSHVGIIMDGNGRWAKKRLLPRNAGHREGVNRLRGIIKASSKLGIDSVTTYAFSTENWKRSEDEVSGLMNLAVEYFGKLMDNLVKEHVKVIHCGEKDRIPEKVLKLLDEAQERTRDNDGLIFNFAFNYGSRREIVHAVRAIAEEVQSGTLSVDDITEQTVSDRLYTKGQADPDLIIRTSGEMRLSNFMMYQAAYSEIMVVPDLWPDFSDERYIETLREFSKRDRRFGGVKA